MSITAERKTALITEYATKKGDTGSPVSYTHLTLPTNREV